MVRCKIHDTRLSRDVFNGDRLYCPTCAREKLLPDTPPQEPDWDLIGKYDRQSDRYGDDHGMATAPGGYGWWRA